MEASQYLRALSVDGALLPAAACTTDMYRTCNAKDLQDSIKLSRLYQKWVR